MYIRSVRPSVRSIFAYRAWTALFSTIGGDCEALGKREDKSTPPFFRVPTGRKKLHRLTTQQNKQHMPLRHKNHRKHNK